MENSDAMIELVATAKAFGQRPSSFFTGLSGYAAYCLDVAAAVYVSYLEQGKKPKRDMMGFLLGLGRR
ncbi:hypothetical protein SAMN05421543_101484 [Alicyclobacillus macrosporangiidus]|uniref:Uncharacterized protein n=2 Tax=Alicyclobacillus macrosporangiidus TaxID=392015 RepID=A0A1I7FWD4_9BACL|nr:hypothetical protein SAMN05421543_101484 [Alicyclobacillus macrosporangiidus]